MTSILVGAKKENIYSLTKLEDYAQELINALTDGVIVLDKFGIIICVNNVWNDFGIANSSESCINHIGANYLTLCDQVVGSDSEYAFAMASGLRSVINNHNSEFMIEYPCHSPSENRWFSCRVSSFSYNNIFRILMTHRDITNLKRVEFDLSIQNKEKEKQALELITTNNQLTIAATAFESQGGILVTDANKIILRVNRAFTAITGYSEQELLGKTSYLLNPSLVETTFRDEIWKSVEDTGEWAGEIWNHRKNGEIYPEQMTITAAKDANGIVINYIINLIDITLSKAASQEIQQLAFYDHLTNLPNRRLLVDRIEQALATSKNGSSSGALLFIDLDFFKTLNDTLGHDCGDLLLKLVSARLTESIKASDTVARIGGDEFVVLLEGLSKDRIEAATESKAIGDRIILYLNQFYQLGSHKYFITASIGITLLHLSLLETEELLQQADIAMYQAKKAGRNNMRFFDQQMQDAISIKASMQKDLNRALESDQFKLYYQIQVNSSNKPVGAEALVRWANPKRGLVSPDDFIALAEETGLIMAIGRWVLNTACAQLKAWESNLSTCFLSISINVSAKQCHQLDFVSEVIAAINEHAINPSLLKLELTESILLDNIDEFIITMQKLKEVGILFSLDDFGTGYSSLHYLKKLPLYQLKIDRSFVKNIALDNSDQVIVRTIIAMANSLELNVIAEGVENEQQRKFLESNQCSHFQGYLFGKPLPIEQFEAALKNYT